MKNAAFLLVLFFQFVGAQELALVKQDGKFGYLAKTGEFAIQPTYKEAESFSDGLAGVQENGKWGFIDPKGKWIIEPSFSKVKFFSLPTRSTIFEPITSNKLIVLMWV